jgi:hypothetical protein
LEISSHQEAVALDLATGSTIAEAARKHKVGMRKIKPWNQSPAFLRPVGELRAEMTSRALGRLTDAMAGAADTLRNLLKSKSDTVKLGAARAMLEMGLKVREATELEERIAALENEKGKAR